jgi:hypothetical protein
VERRPSAADPSGWLLNDRDLVDHVNLRHQYSSTPPSAGCGPAFVNRLTSRRS